MKYMLQQTQPAKQHFIENQLDIAQVFINIKMSFIKNIITKLSPKKSSDSTNANNLEKPSMIMMESDTLGMTIIQQSNQDGQNITQLTNQEWVNMLTTGKLDGVPYNRIYFSFLKGIPNFLRMKIWLLFCTQASSRNYKFCGEIKKKVSSQELSSLNGDNINQEIEKKQIKVEQKQKEEDHGLFSTFTLQLFEKLTTSKPPQKQSQQIQKDIKRTYSYKIKYLYTQPLLRKILYALSNSNVEYTQGMNYILLYVIIFCLESLGIDEKTFSVLHIENERSIFIILREIVLRLEEVFNYENIFKVLKQLEQKISETVPEVFYIIYKLGMDTYSLFAQNYYSLLTYSDPPDELTKQMIDLFFLQGDKAITSLIVRMLELSKDEILKIKDPEVMQSFVKRDMFHYCFKDVSEQKLNAKKIGDFGISFYHNVQQC